MDYIVTYRTKTGSDRLQMMHNFSTPNEVRSAFALYFGTTRTLVNVKLYRGHG